MKIKINSGFVLLEALLAVGLLILFLGGLGALFVLNLRGTSLINYSTQAGLLARGGLEALRTIDFDDLSLLDPAHLVFSGSSWAVAAGSETTDIFIRTIRVKEVQRNSSCDIVASGGTADPDSKFIESEVSWTDELGRVHQTLLAGLVTRWDDPQGPCFAPSAAANLIFHVDLTYWYGHRQLREVYLENSGALPITISFVTFAWNNEEEEEEIEQIFIDSTKIWSKSGPGSPSGKQPSGTKLDVQDYTINAGDIVNMNKTQFEGHMDGAILILTLEFSDGSTFVSPPFTPH